MIMMIATWKDLFECLDQFYHQGKFFLLRNRENLGEGAIDRRCDGWETICIGFDWCHLHELDSKSINIHDITKPWSLVKNMSTRLQSILWPFCQVTQLLTFQVRRHEIFLSSCFLSVRFVSPPTSWVYVLCLRLLLERTSCVSSYFLSVRFVFLRASWVYDLCLPLHLECTSCVSACFLSVRLVSPRTS